MRCRLIRLTMRNPFHTNDYKTSVRLNFKCLISYEFLRCSRSMKELCIGMTRKCPERRLTAEDSLSSRALCELMQSSTVFPMGSRIAKIDIKGNKSGYIVREAKTTRAYTRNQKADKENENTTKEFNSGVKRVVTRSERKEGVLKEVNGNSTNRKGRKRFLRVNRYQTGETNARLLKKKIVNASLMLRVNDKKMINIYANRTITGIEEKKKQKEQTKKKYGLLEKYLSLRKEKITRQQF